MRKPHTVESPVLVIDALGFSANIKAAGERDLIELVTNLERQYHQFNAKTPRRIVWEIGPWIFGSREFAAMRLNDMFILYATRVEQDPHLKFLVSSSILFQSMLLVGQIPRGGLGFGSLCWSKGLLIGSGFIDAYEAAEKRDKRSRHVCAVQLSRSFFSHLPNTKHLYKLLCFFEGKFYVHPWTLTDPEMGAFSPARIIALLTAAGANQEKLDATQRFLEGLEDYESATRPGSITRRTLEVNGMPWPPRSVESDA